MEVKAGYKQTEVGVIPDDWDVTQLGDCLLIHPSYGINAAAVPYAEGLPVYIRITDINNDGHFAPNPRVSVRSQSWDAYTLEDGDVVFARTGASVGKSYRYNPADGPLVFAGFLIRVRPDPEKLLPAFIEEYVKTGRYWRWVQLTSMRSGQPGINGNEYAQLPLPLPRLPEQRAIAETLSDVDALLIGLDRLVAKKRDLKQAAMQQLLTGQTRLPGFGTEKGFVTTELGLLPRDWIVEPLVRLVDPARGIRYGIVQPGEYDPSGRLMIRGQDYSEAKGWADPSAVFRVSARVEERYRNARVTEGDLIMTIVGYCGHVEIVPDWLNGANLTQTTARIAIHPDRAVGTYCKYMLQSQLGKSQVAAYLKGAAQPGLNCGDVEKFLVSLPPREEQTAIAAVLSDMDAELTALEARRDKTRALKQSMMQELLTGRTRLV